MWKYLNCLNYTLWSASSEMKGRRHDRICRKLVGCRAMVEWLTAGQNLSTWRRICQGAYCQHTTDRRICQGAYCQHTTDRRICQGAYCQHTTDRKISNCELWTVWPEGRPLGTSQISFEIFLNWQVWRHRRSICSIIDTLSLLAWVNIYSLKQHQYLLVLQVLPIPVGPAGTSNTCWSCRYPQ
jgi:hypothetical protein